MLFSERKIDKAVPIPLYFQLKSIVLDEIKSGSLKVDDSIPTEKELSEIFGLSRTTVRQAILELVQEGWLYRIKSKGTFVSRPKIQQDFLNKLESFNAEMVRKGMKPSTRLLDMKVIQATSAIAENLKISEHDEVIFIYRLRSADDIPVVAIKTYLPYKKCAFILEGHNMENERLYGMLSKSADTAVVKIKRVIEVDSATEEDAKVLNYKYGKPIHFFKSTGYNAQDTIIEYSEARYRGDRSSFEVTICNEN